MLIECEGLNVIIMEMFPCLVNYHQYLLVTITIYFYCTLFIKIKSYW